MRPEESHSPRTNQTPKRYLNESQRLLLGFGGFVRLHWTHHVSHFYSANHWSFVSRDLGCWWSWCSWKDCYHCPRTSPCYLRNCWWSACSFLSDWGDPRRRNCRPNCRRRALIESDLLDPWLWRRLALIYHSILGSCGLLGCDLGCGSAWRNLWWSWTRGELRRRLSAVLYPILRLPPDWKLIGLVRILDFLNVLLCAVGG